MHNTISITFQTFLNGFGSITESLKDSSDVITFFHTNNSHLVFFINPYKKVFSIIVEDTTSIRPMSTTTRREEKCGIRFLEEVTIGTE
jgi:hypothetical protein